MKKKKMFFFVKKDLEKMAFYAHAAVTLMAEPDAWMNGCNEVPRKVSVVENENDHITSKPHTMRAFAKSLHLVTKQKQK